MKSIAVLESETQATVSRVRGAIAAIQQRAADEGRAETNDERARIDALLHEATTAKAQLDRRQSDDAIASRLQSLVPVRLDQPTLPYRPGTGNPAIAGHTQLASIGTQFGQHFAGWLQASGATRGQRWETPPIEVPYASMFAATLTGDPSSGGDLVIPDYRPGIVPTFFRRLVVADLFAPGTTTSNLVTYMVEKSFVNAADTVAEGAQKPESTITFDAASDPVRKIAHYLPVSDEMMEDVPQMGSYLDARLRHGVQLTEEDQLLNGTAVAPDIVGIRNRAGLAPDVTRTDPETPADAIARQISAIQIATGLAPTGIVMNPTDWLGVQLLKATDGTYIGDGPFMRPVAPTLWGLPVAVTPVLESGVALVGAFATAAMVFRKGGIRVDATNAHLDWYTKNLLCVRAELREALACFRPAAFGEVLLGVTP